MTAAKRDVLAEWRASNEAASAITGLSQDERTYLVGWLTAHRPDAVIAACEAARANTAKHLERSDSAPENRG